MVKSFQISPTRVYLVDFIKKKEKGVTGVRPRWRSQFARENDGRGAETGVCT